MWTLDRGRRTLQITKGIKDVVWKFAHRTFYSSTEMHIQLTLIYTQPTESVYQSALCYVLVVSCYARFYNTLEWLWKDWQIWTKRHGNSLSKTVLAKQVSEQYVCFVDSWVLVQDDECSNWSFKKMPENVENICELNYEDCRHTIRQLSCMIGISYGIWYMNKSICKFKLSTLHWFGSSMIMQ